MRGAPLEILLITGCLMVLTGCGVTADQQASSSTTEAVAEKATMDEKDIYAIQEACSQIYQLDWTNVPLVGAMPEMARDYTAIKNGAVRLGEEARATVESLSNLVLQMDKEYDLYNSKVRATGSKLSIHSTQEELDAIAEETSRNSAEFYAARDSVAEEINLECKPYFN